MNAIAARQPGDRSGLAVHTSDGDGTTMTSEAPGDLACLFEGGDQCQANCQG
jgi:hypothetical protein